MDAKVRAVDLLTGDELWSDDLPAMVDGTPMSYVAPRTGKQRLVVQVPSGGMFSFGGSLDGGGVIIAYGLE